MNDTIVSEEKKMLNINATATVIKKFRRMHTKWQDSQQDKGIPKKETSQRLFLMTMLRSMAKEIGVDFDKLK